MADDPLAVEDLARMEQSLIVGLARGSLTAPALVAGARSPALATLALLGQRKRFGRPAAPSVPPGEPVLPPDDRPILPEAARPILLRLLTGRDSITWDLVARAVLDRLGDQGLRLHPFDLPKLGKYLREVADTCRLGPSEAAWVARSADGDPADHALDDDEITEESWQTYPKAKRIAFAERVRRDDAARGRALIEATFSGDPAALRGELVRVFRIGLSAEDRPFLEQALGDRARSVKDAAGEVLGLLPGTEAYQARQAEALARIEKKKSRLLSSKPRLVLKDGKKRDPEVRAAEARDLLDGVRLADIAAHHDLSVEAVLEGAAEDHALHEALLRNAAGEGRWDLVRAQAGLKGADWTTIFAAVADALLALPMDERRAMAREIMGRAGFGAAGDRFAFDWLYDGFGGPLDADLADAFLASACWQNLLSRKKDVASGVTAAAALIPAARSDRFVAALEPLEEEAKSRALLFHRFLAALPDHP